MSYGTETASFLCLVLFLMGCGGSKADDQPLVILCKERKELIRAASRHRVALAASHLAYFQSLSDVGQAIRRFVDEEIVIASSSSPPDSPVLTLPSYGVKPRKPNNKSFSSTSMPHSVSVENCHGDRNRNNEEDGEEDTEEGSHLHLSSESGSELSSSDSPESHIHIESSPEKVKEHESSSGAHPIGLQYGYGSFGYSGYGQGQGYGGYGQGYGYGSMEGNTSIYYMRKSIPPAQSVVFRPPENHRLENGQWPADLGSGYPGHFPAHPDAGVFGYPPQQQPDARTKTLPPAKPPSPPRVSTWDFFNVFDTYDYGTNGGEGHSSYYPAQNRFGFGSNSSSPDSKEVREREGIPDLEEETEQEPILEVNQERKKKNKVKEHKLEETSGIKMNRERYPGEGASNSRQVPEQKSNESSSSTNVLSSLHSDDGSEFVNGSSNEGHSYSSVPDTVETEISVGEKEEEEEEEYVRKKGVSFEMGGKTSFDVESSKLSSLTTLSVHGTRDIKEAVDEIKNEFEVASSHGRDVAMLLEVSQLPYQQKNAGLKVIFSRILHLIAPSLLASASQPLPYVRLTSRTLKAAKTYSALAGGDRTSNLSSTLEKLYAWEKKLYKEVKDEEKLRVIYEERCKRLMRLDQQGAESSKIDAARGYIRKLQTKIDVCIRSIDSISSQIHKLRDEELQPQLTLLIHGLVRMWRSMLKCHQKQFQAIMESKVRSLRANTGAFSRDSGLRATLDLEMELREWCVQFSNWITTQKSYVESINGWLSRCLHEEPEETEDGVAPFSPSRAGAPPVFIICRDWHEAMTRISGENVANAMRGFAVSLHELWERQDEEQRQRHELKKRIKTLQTENGQETFSPEAAVSMVRSNSGVSPLDDLKVDLDSMRQKLAEERARHMETIKLVHTAVSSSLKAGLVPIFEALGNFTSEVVKVHEQIRVPGG